MDNIILELDNCMKIQHACNWEATQDIVRVLEYILDIDFAICGYKDDQFELQRVQRG